MPTAAASDAPVPPVWHNSEFKKVYIFSEEQNCSSLCCMAGLFRFQILFPVV